jgi:hypothetical protein
MSQPVEWPDAEFDQWSVFLQGGEDTILVKKVPDTGQVLGQGFALRIIGLETAAHITWLKRIRILDLSGHELSTVTTQNSNHGPVWLKVPSPPDVGMGQTEFVKAKGLGFPTGMYMLSGFAWQPAPSTVQPYGLLFRWEQD